MNLRLAILITGCSSGIGRATALHLASAGHRVFATMRDVNGKNADAKRDLLETAASHGHTLQVVELDVTDADSVSAAMATVQHAGGLDVVVHNAGVAAVGLVEQQSIAVAQRIFDVNVLGPIRVQQAALPLLRASERPLVIGISSTLARERAPFLATYTASKHAFAALLTTWSYELNPEGIRTVLIEPGTIPSTAMLHSLLPSDRPIATAQEALAGRAQGLVAGLQAFGQSPEAPRAEVVAGAVAKALAADAPDRIVVDPSGFDGCARINAVAARVQDDLLGNYGMSDLSTARRAP
jgi:NAD(P)-dependent dehydrogenase (short-subunit alcohol dehydrogenase family)